MFIIISAADSKLDSIIFENLGDENILTSRNEMGQATQVAAYLDKEKPWVSR